MTDTDLFIVILFVQASIFIHTTWQINKILEKIKHHRFIITVNDNRKVNCYEDEDGEIKGVKKDEDGKIN